MDADGLNQRLANLSPAKKALLELRLKQNRCHEQAIARRPSRDSAPLSFAQQRLWFLNQLEPESPAYNESRAYRLNGVLHMTALQKALDQIVARHEVLRTNFVSVDGNPTQVIAETRPVELPRIDLSAWPESGREAEARRLLLENVRRPFDLSREAMLRVMLLCLDEQEHILLVVKHHIASDGWSSGIFWQELADLYRSLIAGGSSALPELPIQYADFAVWQRNRLQGDILEAQLAYWKKQLDGVESLRLPTDRRRSATSTSPGAKQSLTFPRELSDGLKALSRQQGATLFMTLLAAFQTLLNRYTGQTDIAVGTPIAGRTRLEVEKLIGFFVNTLVLRTDCSNDPTFRELLDRVKQKAVDAYAHQELPFEKLVEVLQPERNIGGSPLFHVTFQVQNTPRSSNDLPGLTLSPVEVASGTAKFDLSLSMREEPDGLKATLDYNTDLFDGETISRMLGHLQVLLDGIVTDPDRPISALPILTEPERHQLLVEWNDTKREYPKDKCIPGLFEEQAEKTPDAAAVVFEGEQLTYGELNARANQLAHHLRKLGVGPEVLVGICVERSLEMVVGLLGILKAGGAYVPLDPEYPKDRLAFQLEDTRARVLLTQERLLAALPEHDGRVICLDRDWAEIARESEANPESGVTAENLAYVIYTSGSTGKPKGVMIQHRALSNHMLWMQERFPLDRVDCVLQKTPFCFDASVWEFFAPIMAGARLALARPGGHQDGAYLINTIANQQVTTLQLVPSMLRMLLAEDGLERCQNLKRVFCGGEALPVELREQFHGRLGGELHNLYGPTEATIDATCALCDRASPPHTVTIGRPIANTQVYVLDPDLQPIPIGVPGELYIGGECLARGYLNRPKLTAEMFITHSFDGEPARRLYKTGDLARYLSDGNIEFLGRIDNQVKIRGYRIELGEIESVLCQHPGVMEAVVVAREDVPGDKRLVAYLVAASQNSSVSELRGFLKAKLPEYMIPSASMFLESLPLMPNGKIDRKSLPAPDRHRDGLEQAYVALRSPTEEILAGIWAEVLKIEQVGIHDNFFELGGHSLLATRVVSRIRDSFRIDFPLRRIFETPTIAGLAEWLEKAKSTGSSANLAGIVAVPRRARIPNLSPRS